MEQIVRRVTPCNYMGSAAHTESIMQREFSGVNKLRTAKKQLILLA
jgi:hypothetical protein